MTRHGLGQPFTSKGLCRLGLPPCPSTAVQQLLISALQMSMLQTGPLIQQGLCQLACSSPHV